MSTLIKSQFKFKKSKKEIYKRLLESLKSFQVWSESKEKYPRRPLANLGVGGLLRIAANFLGIRVLKWSLIKNSFLKKNNRKGNKCDFLFLNFSHKLCLDYLKIYLFEIFGNVSCML